MDYKKGYSSQHSLISMFEKVRENLNEGEKWYALFVDLSKALDFLSHDLLLAKLNAYRFDYKSNKLNWLIKVVLIYTNCIGFAVYFLFER